MSAMPVRGPALLIGRLAFWNQFAASDIFSVVYEIPNIIGRTPSFRPPLSSACLKLFHRVPFVELNMGFASRTKLSPVVTAPLSAGVNRLLVLSRRSVNRPFLIELFIRLDELLFGVVDERCAAVRHIIEQQQVAAGLRRRR
jgi:hypothetical protein